MSEERPFTVEEFFKFLKTGELMGAKCDRCGSLMLPPRPICRDCGSRELQWIRLRDTGIVEALTVIHIAPSKFKEEAPYPLAIIRLDDGPKVTARITCCKLEEVSVGSRVEGDREGWVKNGTLTFKPLKSNVECR